MRALVWHGKEDIRCDTVTDPETRTISNAYWPLSSIAWILGLMGCTISSTG